MKRFLTLAAGLILFVAMAASQAHAFGHGNGPVVARYMETIQAMPDSHPEKARLFNSAFALQDEILRCETAEGHSDERMARITDRIGHLEQQMRAANLETGNYSAVAATEETAYTY